LSLQAQGEEGKAEKKSFLPDGRKGKDEDRASFSAERERWKGQDLFCPGL
jgi:hypothetical protein